MLIKEYRIPLPLSVDEYRIAQLYMIAKKSREETQGAGSGVEIIINEPYTGGPGGNGGQYTKKIYHVGQHLPGWLKALLPKSALIVEEEAWNAYPYTKTRYTCPFVEKFFIEIETRYFNDAGHQDNVFNLSNGDLRERIVDVIDIVKDELHGSDYVKEEDPEIFISEKTNRGPLNENWVENYCDSYQKYGIINGKAIMCAYKLCRVEFKYWGMQSKIEKFIHDSALRRVMLRAHRQAWAWQDEWVGLTMEDIRKLEKETQETLAKKMAHVNDTNLDDGSENTNNNNSNNNDNSNKTKDLESSSPRYSAQSYDLNAIDKDNDDGLRKLNMESTKLKCSMQSIHNSETNICNSNQSSRKSSKSGNYSPNTAHDFDTQLSSWRTCSVANESSETSSNDEYYDAQEHLDRIEEVMVKINVDMKEAEKALTFKEQCCSICTCPCNKSSESKENENTWRSNDGSKVINGQPARLMDDRNGAAPITSYKARITKDEMQDEIVQVSTMIGNLRNMAIDMGQEIRSQNSHVGRINIKADSNRMRMQGGNEIIEIVFLRLNKQQTNERQKET